MYFNKSEYNNDKCILNYCTYYPYRIHGEKNPQFDETSATLLALKRSEKYAIDSIFNLLERDLHNNVVVAIVPSSTANTTTHGLYKVANKLAKKGKVDGSSCLVRHTSIDKLATGGNRNIDVHLNSVKVENNAIIYDKYVILLDDITTSGNSLKACKQLLLEAGAKGVQCLAIGKTEGY